jgi:hypothetical protein
VAGPPTGVTESTAAAAVGSLVRAVKAAAAGIGRAAGGRKRGSCAGGNEENVRATRLRSGFAGLAT